MRLALLLLLAGCDSGAPHGNPDLAPAAPHITTSATDGTLTLMGADFSVSGMGIEPIGTVGSFSLSHGSGTVELNGNAVPAAVYQRQVFMGGGPTLYQALAAEEHRLWVLWFYCSAIDNTIANVFFENTDGVMVKSEAVHGNCQDSGTTSMVTAQFPALDLAQPALVDGYTMDGASVKLMGAQPGSVDLGGKPLEVLVFNVVDCRTNCNQTPGWTELHSLLWDRDGGRVCFAIFYLSEGDTSHVQLAYSLTLPTLDDPAANVVLPASWTRP